MKNHEVRRLNHAVPIIGQQGEPMIPVNAVTQLLWPCFFSLIPQLASKGYEPQEAADVAMKYAEAAMLKIGFQPNNQGE